MNKATQEQVSVFIKHLDILWSGSGTSKFIYYDNESKRLDRKLKDVKRRQVETDGIHFVRGKKRNVWRQNKQQNPESHRIYVKEKNQCQQKSSEALSSITNVGQDSVWASRFPNKSSSFRCLGETSVKLQKWMKKRHQESDSNRKKLFSFHGYRSFWSTPGHAVSPKLLSLPQLQPHPSTVTAFFTPSSFSSLSLLQHSVFMHHFSFSVAFPLSFVIPLWLFLKTSYSESSLASYAIELAPRKRSQNILKLVCNNAIWCYKKRLKRH